MHFLSDIITQSAPLLVSLAGALASALTLSARKYLKSKTDNDLLDAAINRLGKIVDSVVCDVEAGVVKDIKSRATDGKLTTQDAREVRHRAVSMVAARMPKTDVAALRSLGSLTEVIASEVERSVSDRKQT